MAFRSKIQDYLTKKNYSLINHNPDYRANIFPFIKRLYSRNKQLKIAEYLTITSIVKKLCDKKKGNLAEVGVFVGTTAKAIAEMKGNNPLYLFDTFEGLPRPTKEDEGEFIESFFSNTSLESVKHYLKDYPNINLYTGLFPDSAPQEIKDKKFIFVHLDVDLYESTTNCLGYFYDRMEKGGIILSHDYNNHIGVRKAFDRFFKDKDEIVIALPTTQCLVVKL